MTAKPSFKVGDTVRTIKGASFWGVVKALYEVEPDNWRADVFAVDPGFYGTLHVYPTSQLAAFVPDAP